MLLDSTSPTRQLVAVSATIPPRTETFMRALMHDPISVAVGDMGAPVTNVVQTVVWAAEAVLAVAQRQQLRNLLANQRASTILTFAAAGKEASALLPAIPP